MLIALPQFQKEELLASLLIFRFVYFIMPLCGAVLALGLRELWVSSTSTSPSCDPNGPDSKRP